MNHSGDWIIDNGCTHHMNGDRSKFIQMEECDGGWVRFGNDDPFLVKGKGNISLNDMKNCDDLYWVDALRYNLLSVSKLNKKGYRLEFNGDTCRIIGKLGDLISTSEKTKGNMFHLNSTAKSCLIAKIEDCWLWHKRFCHVNFDNQVKLRKMKIVRGFPNLVEPDNVMCKECQLGNLTSSSFTSKSYSTKIILDLVHTNLCGPMRIQSYYDRYFMFLIVEYSRMMQVVFLKDKSKSFHMFKIYKDRVEKESGKTLKCLRFDRGGEFT